MSGRRGENRTRIICDEPFFVLTGKGRGEAMIKTVRVTNFKSLTDVSVNLDPVTILIGRSGSGKTNFVEALRWLRAYLTLRDDAAVQNLFGGWDQVMSASAARPMILSFSLTFAAPNINRDFSYFIAFQQPQPQHPPMLYEERLVLGTQVLFHHQKGKWLHHPDGVNAHQVGSVMLGGLTGVQEVTIAHLVLTRGIGCYAFPDNVLTQADQSGSTDQAGLTDNGSNFLRIFTGINDNLHAWHHLQNMAASLRTLKRTLKSIDLQMPQRAEIQVTHAVDDRSLRFALRQESEGFRRLLACLIALYQEPPKQTLIFDEPEKGIYPAGLATLAEEFKGYATKGRGQVLLTTHSPEFLDHFAPEQIRVVEMQGYQTRIGPVSPEQMEALREHYLEPKELLTADEARLEGTLTGTR
jgi:predicted ATPase